ncbi:lysophosphatidic acid receptor 6 [Scyliorhinus canicula]|uniref:lysophosphatidic acid receptor 6 n=1 Tax=Scyliorhinus canicula TaxID=7830 RepID=UPI0018F33AA4|nr:lysophosphatidic acid receptor 6 [Scyliorhinus canicula]
MTNSSQEPSSDASCTLEANFQYYLFPVVYSTVFILGLIGNVLALCLMTKEMKKASPSYVYITNLVVVDLIYICTLPFRIHYHTRKNDWPFGDVACRITGTLYFANVYISIAFLSLICLDRYIAVVHPRKYIRMKNTHFSKFIAVLVWVLSMAIMLPLVFSGTLNNISKNNTTACFENFDPDTWNKRMAAYNVVVLVFGFSIPFTVIVIFYPLAAKKIAQLKCSAACEKALTMIRVILVISVVCFVPYHVTHFFYFLTRLNVIQNCAFARFLYKFRRITMALTSLNSALDPLIYYFATAHFKLSFNRKKRSIRQVLTFHRERKSVQRVCTLTWQKTEI